MNKNLVLLLVLFAFVFAAVPRKAQCVIEASNYNKVAGTIMITYDGATATTFDVSLTTTTDLHPNGNGFHVHQYGVDAYSNNCGDAGKHYNPTLNYGEISARAVKIPVNGSVTINTNWLFFEGEYSILGRGLVVHDNTTTRLGCCTIELTEDGVGGEAALGYAGSVLKARIPGLNVTIYHSGGMNYMNITTSALFTSVNNSFSFNTGCDGPALINGTTTFTNAIVVDLKIDLGSWSTGVGPLAGRYLVVTPVLSGTPECALIIQYGSAQPNYANNDFYIPPDTNSTTNAGPTATVAPSKTETGFAYAWVVSMLLLIVSLLI